MPKEAGFAALVTSLALILYLALGINVGRARVKFNVQPPTTSGNPDFERVYRVHQNTLEHMVPFLAGLWMFSLLVDPKIGAALGGVWIVGRILYAWGYYQEAKKRGPGFGISILAQFGLILGALYGAIMSIIR